MQQSLELGKYEKGLSLESEGNKKACCREYLPAATVRSVREAQGSVPDASPDV